MHIVQKTGEEMKGLLKILTTSLFLIAISGNYFAQNSSPEKDAASTLKTLFDLSKARSYEKAAPLIAYTGDDKGRLLNTAFNPADKEELNQVKRICKKISALLDISDKYEIGTLTSAKADGKEIFTADVSFINGDQKLNTTFKLIKIKNAFLLSEMN